MDKRRKYNGKNKLSFIIILVVSIVIIGIFSLFIFKYSKISKIKYEIESGSVIQDVDKNHITLDNSAALKIKWGGKYYLINEEENINLGKKVIVYNTVTGRMNLYGTFYEINADGKIIELKDENILKNTTETKFYKLDDREYLLVGSKIYSEDNSIQTDNYLLVELDKAGNAKLSNNKINLKTITPTKLVTSEYTFDIANEILNFGDYDIDLKKIIGSTNQYVPEEENKDGGDGEGAGGALNGEGTGQGNGFGTTIGNDNVVNNNDDGEINDLDDLKDKGKMTSVIRVIEGLNQIDIDYVVYDPFDEYKTLYIEVIRTGKIDIVYLDKSDTHVNLSDLLPNTEYQLNFVYTTANESDYFGQFKITTKKPVYEISVEKISTYNKDLEYKVNLQDDFNIKYLSVSLLFEGYNIKTKQTESILIDDPFPITENDLYLGFVKRTISLKNYKISADTVMLLTVNSVESPFGHIDIGTTNSFRIGRDL